MMPSIEILKLMHVLGAAVLFGTGAGIAFFMLMAHRTRDPHLIAHVAGTVVIADALFTATAVVAQPVTGLLLAYVAGWPLTEGWILVSLGLYVLVGALWLPVVAIQMRLRRLAETAAREHRSLPDQYNRLFRIWFWCGWPAFAGVLAIFWLMLTKPAIPLL